MTITSADLAALTARLDIALAPFSANMRLSLHFGADRLNDGRNNPPITIAELEDVFMRFIGQHLGSALSLKDNSTFNVRCLTSHINMPCGIRKYSSDPNNRMVVITIMRNKHWFSKDPHDFHVV